MEEKRKHPGARDGCHSGPTPSTYRDAVRLRGQDDREQLSHGIENHVVTPLFLCCNGSFLDMSLFPASMTDFALGYPVVGEGDDRLSQGEMAMAGSHVPSLAHGCLQCTSFASGHRFWVFMGLVSHCIQDSMFRGAKLALGVKADTGFFLRKAPRFFALCSFGYRAGFFAIN